MVLLLYLLAKLKHDQQMCRYKFHNFSCERGKDGTWTYK